MVVEGYKSRIQVILGGAHFCTKIDERLFRHESKRCITFRADAYIPVALVVPQYYFSSKNGSHLKGLISLACITVNAFLSGLDSVVQNRRKTKKKSRLSVSL